MNFEGVLKRAILISLVYFFLSFQTAKSAFDKNKVEDLVNLYIELLTNYSNAPNNSVAQDKRRELYNLFEYPELKYAFDLFDFSDQFAETGISYLRIIDQVYGNKIAIECNDIHVFNCTQVSKGVEFAFVTMSKELKYVGDKSEFLNKKKRVRILLGINVSNLNYKINKVIFPEEYVSRENSCIIDEKQDDQIAFFNENVILADAYYEDNNLVLARQYFEKALMYKNDPMVISKLKTCDDKIDLDALIKNSEKELTDGKFIMAKLIYEKLALKYPERRQFALEKINYCNQQIKRQNYEEYIKIGDNYYEKKFYSVASTNYKIALSYSNGNVYALDMIRKCDNSDEPAARQGIAKARLLVSQFRKKDFPELVEILTYYEPSGLLTGQDYYNLAAILDVAYQNVNAHMSYTKIQSYHLAKEYCLKSRARGYKSADNLWYDRFNKNARNL